VVMNLRLDKLIEDFAITAAEMTPIVIADGGEVVYHPNGAFNHQPISAAQPELSRAALGMMKGQIGEAFYKAAQGDEWLMEYGPLGTTGLAIGIASNHSSAIRSIKRIGWISIGSAFLLGITVAVVLVNLAHRSTKSLSHVAAGAAAIAKGELDMPIELQ